MAIIVPPAYEHIIPYPSENEVVVDHDARMMTITKYVSLGNYLIPIVEREMINFPCITVVSYYVGMGFWVYTLKEEDGFIHSRIVDMNAEPLPLYTPPSEFLEYSLLHIQLPKSN